MKKSSLDNDIISRRKKSLVRGDNISSSMHERQPRQSERSHKRGGGTQHGTEDGEAETLKDFDAIVKGEQDKVNARAA